MINYFPSHEYTKTQFYNIYFENLNNHILDNDSF